MGRRRAAVLALVVSVALGAGACTHSVAESGQACTLNSDCHEPLVCAAAVCRPQCRADRDCASGEHCATFAGGGVCVPPMMPVPCFYSSECGAALACVGGTCRAQCREDRDCSHGTCTGGTCSDPVLTPPADASVDGDVPDGDVDADVDAGTDAGGDAGPTDAGVDAGADLGPLDDPPRLVSPLSTSRVTTRTPLITWEQAPTADGARVTFCADRGCTVSLGTAMAMGTSVAPTSPLPRGVVFFYAEGTRGGRLMTRRTPTWQVVVPALAASVDTSWGATADFDGDGRADAVVGATNDSTVDTGVLSVFRGDAARMPATPDDLVGVAATRFGVSIAAAGDVNGDGYGDLVVGAPEADVPSTPPSYGNVSVYLGGATGLETTPTTRIFGPYGLGFRVASAGDLDGDGYGDVVATSSTGHLVTVYPGSPTGVLGTPLASFHAHADDVYWGWALHAADLDGDGTPELVIGAHSDSFFESRAYVEDPDGAGGYAETLLHSSARDHFGFNVTATDANADGYADLFVSAHVGDRIDVFPGGPAGVAMPPATSITTTTPSDVVGLTLADAGDVNGDGYGDLVAGTLSTFAFVYRGGPMGITATTTPVMLSMCTGSPCRFGAVVGSLGDADGDGLDDVLAGDADVRSATLFYGHATSGIRGSALLAVDRLGFGASLVTR